MDSSKRVSEVRFAGTPEPESNPVYLGLIEEYGEKYLAVTDKYGAPVTSGRILSFSVKNGLLSLKLCSGADGVPAKQDESGQVTIESAF